MAGRLDFAGGLHGPAGPGRAELSFYSARVDKDAVSMQPGETEELAFFHVGHFDGTGEPFPYETAGAGDAEYFIMRALGAMRDA